MEYLNPSISLGYAVGHFRSCITAGQLRLSADGEGEEGAMGAKAHTRITALLDLMTRVLDHPMTVRKQDCQHGQ